jgi:hypothetical protein
MENAQRTHRYRAPAGLAALLLALAAGGANGGTAAGTIGVNLRITASCEVDRAALMDAARPGRAALPQVHCAHATPRAIRVTHERPGAPLAESEGAGQGYVRVITLTF